jgi:hypothetical protein
MTKKVIGQGASTEKCRCKKRGGLRRPFEII